MEPETVTHLTAGGVSVVVSTPSDRLPRVLYWGAALGDRDSLDSLTAAATEPRVNWEADARPGIAIVPEPSWGWMGTPGIVGHRGGLDHSTRFATRACRVTRDGAERLVIDAADQIADLDIQLVVELLPSGLLRTRATLTSTGPGSSAEGEPYTIDALTLALPVPAHATEVLDFAGRWIRERTPQRREFTVGTHLRETRRGKPGHDNAFLLAVGRPGFGFRSGQLWGTHVAWSGNARTLAERTSDGAAIVGGGELLMPGEVRLEPGHSYESPWVYGIYGDGLDEASARVHRYLRSRDAHPSTPRPVIVNTWEAVYFDHDHDKLRALVAAAADIGAERFVLDDGWFRHRRSDNAGLGDWHVDETVYPDGLEWLAELVRDSGMEFGLWVEPEMINPDSDLARAHPEWIAQPYRADRSGVPGGNRLPLEARSQQVLDLTHAEAYAHIRDRLISLVTQLQPTYLKWDHNRDLIEAGNSTTGRAIGRAQTRAFYRLVDELKQAFPGIEIEACAGGGGRIDLAILEHTDRVWTSDCNDPLERQRIQQYTSLLVPPEMMGAHIGPPTAHTTGRTHTLDFRAGTAMWGHLGLEWNVAAADAAEPATRAKIRAWVDLHKRHRALLHSGDVVRSDRAPAGRLVHGVVARDRSEALFAFVATDSVAENPVGAMYLEGLDPAVNYTVRGTGPLDLPASGKRSAPPWWNEGVSMTGRALAQVGIQPPALHPEELALVRVTRAPSTR